MKKCFILAWLLLPTTWLLTGCSDNMETTAPERRLLVLSLFRWSAARCSRRHLPSRATSLPTSFSLRQPRRSRAQTPTCVYRPSVCSIYSLSTPTAWLTNRRRRWWTSWIWAHWTKSTRAAVNCWPFSMRTTNMSKWQWSMDCGNRPTAKR